MYCESLCRQPAALAWTALDLRVGFGQGRPLITQRGQRLGPGLEHRPFNGLVLSQGGSQATAGLRAASAPACLGEQLHMARPPAVAEAVPDRVGSSRWIS